MSFTSLGLILASACVHVVAHVVLKQARDRDAAMWWVVQWSWLVFTPLALLNWQPITPQAWAIILISAVFETAYAYTIAQAYKITDLSLVYPMARGSAPLFLLLWSFTVLGERPTPGGLLGVGAIAAGLYVINLPGLQAWRAPLQALRQAGVRWALLAGLCISLYTATDRFGVQVLNPFTYIWLVMVLTGALLTAVTGRTAGWGGLRAEWVTTGWRMAVGGLTTMAAYTLVLFVLQAGTPASYVGAVREISVVLGAAIGIFVLKEPGTVSRLVAAVLVVVGVMSIKLLG
jgi:drug/metabolite transporter (DMT)-like permease